MRFLAFSLFLSLFHQSAFSNIVEQVKQTENVFNGDDSINSRILGCPVSNEGIDEKTEEDEVVFIEDMPGAEILLDEARAVQCIAFIPSNYRAAMLRVFASISDNELKELNLEPEKEKEIKALKKTWDDEVKIIKGNDPRISKIEARADKYEAFGKLERAEELRETANFMAKNQAAYNVDLREPEIVTSIIKLFDSKTGKMKVSPAEFSTNIGCQGYNRSCSRLVSKLNAETYSYVERVRKAKEGGSSTNRSGYGAELLDEQTPLELASKARSFDEVNRRYTQLFTKGNPQKKRPSFFKKMGEYELTGRNDVTKKEWLEVVAKMETGVTSPVNENSNSHVQNYFPIDGSGLGRQAAEEYRKKSNYLSYAALNSRGGCGKKPKKQEEEKEFSFDDLLLSEGDKRLLETYLTRFAQGEMRIRNPNDPAFRRIQEEFNNFIGYDFALNEDGNSPKVVRLRAVGSASIVSGRYKDAAKTKLTPESQKMVDKGLALLDKDYSDSAKEYRRLKKAREDSPNDPFIKAEQLKAEQEVLNYYLSHGRGNGLHAILQASFKESGKNGAPSVRLSKPRSLGSRGDRESAADHRTASFTISSY